MKSLIKNKKGADKIISVYWFAILFIVSAAMVYMVFLFYGGLYDIRDVEAGILINQMADCVAEGGYIKSGILDGPKLTKENFLQKCGLTFAVEDTNEWSDDQFYVNISFENFKEGSVVDSFEVGNINWKIQCEEKKGTNLAFCTHRNFYVLDKL